MGFENKCFLLAVMLICIVLVSGCIKKTGKVVPKFACEEFEKMYSRDILYTIPEYVENCIDDEEEETAAASQTETTAAMPKIEIELCKKLKGIGAVKCMLDFISDSGYYGLCGEPVLLRFFGDKNICIAALKGPDPLERCQEENSCSYEDYHIAYYRASAYLNEDPVLCYLSGYEPDISCMLMVKMKENKFDDCENMLRDGLCDFVKLINSDPEILLEGGVDVTRDQIENMKVKGAFYAIPEYVKFCGIEKNTADYEEHGSGNGIENARVIWEGLMDFYNDYHLTAANMCYEAQAFVDRNENFCNKIVSGSDHQSVDHWRVDVCFHDVAVIKKDVDICTKHLKNVVFLCKNRFEEQCRSGDTESCKILYPDQEDDYYGVDYGFWDCVFEEGFHSTEIVECFMGVKPNASEGDFKEWFCDNVFSFLEKNNVIPDMECNEFLNEIY